MLLFLKLEKLDNAYRLKKIQETEEERVSEREGNRRRRRRKGKKKDGMRMK